MSLFILLYFTIDLWTFVKNSHSTCMSAFENLCHILCLFQTLHLSQSLPCCLLPPSIFLNVWNVISLCHFFLFLACDDSTHFSSDRWDSFFQPRDRIIPLLLGAIMSCCFYPLFNNYPTLVLYIHMFHALHWGLSEENQVLLIY